ATFPLCQREFILAKRGGPYMEVQEEGLCPSSWWGLGRSPNKVFFSDGVWGEAPTKSFFLMGFVAKPKLNLSSGFVIFESLWIFFHAIFSSE
ncbi:MAG: hypothetical protein H7833_18235, partial [Magnetococcus sp. DMHC-1]